MESEFYPDQRHDSGYVYTVSRLTRELKTIIEDTYSLIWITGEISNSSSAASGHLYFSLKDSDSLINCVIFRNQRKRLPFNPENGMKITGIGRLSLYEPRGSYQLIFEHMEINGTGALQVKFEQLKSKLSDEGLFDVSHKKPLPFLPSRLVVITSRGGAVIRDIINVSQRRFSGIPVQIMPVRVQGDGAENEIATAISHVNGYLTEVSSEADSALSDSDVSDGPVIIIARGGGSLEDLSPFNSETVARAVFASRIPVISAVGHETDFTICDFVADLRAPTPSAAAELAVPDRRVLVSSLRDLESRLYSSFMKRMEALQRQVTELKSRLRNPITAVDDMRFRIEDLSGRAVGRMRAILSRYRENLDWLTRAMYASTPLKRVDEFKNRRDGLEAGLVKSMKRITDKNRSELSSIMAKLEAMSPVAVLKRGYSITRNCSDGKIVMRSSETSIDEALEITLASGKIICRVEESVS